MTKKSFYIDMDDVLCKMIDTFIMRISGDRTWDWPKGELDIDRALYSGAFRDLCAKPSSFWALLPRSNLFSVLKSLLCNGCVDSYIITYAPTPAVMEGKLRWVEVHLPEVDVDRIIFTSKKHLLAQPDRILIDDRECYVDAWRQATGVHNSAILIPQPWNSGEAVPHPDIYLRKLIAICTNHEYPYTPSVIW